MRKQMNKRYFTMVELLVVIGIIGILAALILGSMGGGVDAASKAEAKSIMAKVVAAAISNQGMTGSTAPFNLDEKDLKGGKDTDPWGRNWTLSDWTAKYNKDFERWEVEVTIPEGVKDEGMKIRSWTDTLGK